MAEPFKSDVYITKNLPNPLDYFSSYTYNLTFSALPLSFFQNGVLPIGVNRAPGKIIIAQTGVTTKFNIDDLEIVSVTDPYGSTQSSRKNYSTQLSFSITEPLGASLVTLLQVAFNKLRQMDKSNGVDTEELYKKESGSKGPLDLPYLMEVELIGYRDWSDQTDTELLDGDLSSQEFERLGTWAWPFYLTTFDFNPETEGTVYRFNGVTTHNIGAKLGKETREVVGKTTVLNAGNVNDLLAQLSKQLTEDSKQYTLKGKSDENISKGFHNIHIELGKLYEGPNDKTGSTDWHDDIQEIPEHLLEETQPKETSIDDTTEGTQGTGGEGQKVLLGDVTIKPGMSHKDCILECLKMSPNLAKYIGDREIDVNAGTVGKPLECNAPQWAPRIKQSCIIDPKAQSLPNGGPAFTITYSVNMLKQCGVSTNQESATNGDDEKKKKEMVDQWNIVKRYDYMFTGVSDQVLNLDISFPQGQIFLFPANDGLTPTYKDTPAKAVKAKEITHIKDKENEKILRLVERGAGVDALIKHFEQLGKDLKNTVTNLGKNTRDLIDGLEDQVKSSKGVSGSLRGDVSKRLPSSPSAIFVKSKAIATGTQVVDALFKDVQEFQQAVESAAEDLAGFANTGLDVAAGQIAKIIADSANPFEFTSSLASKLDSVSQGIDGLVGNVNEALSGTGISLRPDDIPGLGEAQSLIDNIGRDIRSFTPSGFGGGTGWANDYTFEAIPRGESPDHKITFLEELDFQDETIDDAWDFSSTTLAGEAKDPDPNTNDRNQQQHFMTTVLSYKDHGIPYLVRLQLEIKGDPYWFGRTNYDKSDEAIPSILESPGILKQEFSDDRTENHEEAPYGAGSVLTAFRYMFPKEYNHYQDDFESHTGVVNFEKTDPSYSGYYMVVSVIHKFSGGIFKQSLDTVKSMKEPNHPIFIEEQPDVGTTAGGNE